MRGVKMLNPMALRDWALVCTKRDAPTAQSFISTLAKVCPPMGEFSPNTFRTSCGQLCTFVCVSRNESRGVGWRLHHIRFCTGREEIRDRKQLVVDSPLTVLIPSLFPYAFSLRVFDVNNDQGHEILFTPRPLLTSPSPNLTLP